MVDLERCPACHGVIAVIGRTHLCRPRAAAPVPPQIPKPQLSGGAAVKVSKSSRGGVESRHVRKPALAQGGDAADDLGSGTLRGMASEPVAGVATGPRETKLRAKKGTATYAHRDADKHRAYQRDLMKKRRTKEPA